MKKGLLLALGVSITFLLFASSIPAATRAAGLQQAPAEKTLVYALPYTFTEYAIQHADSYATAQWASAIYSSLYFRDTRNDRLYRPDVAFDMPTVSSDSRNFTVTLRSGLKFSNGQPLTADDVVFSYKAALTPAIDQTQYSGVAQYFTNSSITKIDDLTVQFNMTTTYAFALGLLSAALLPQETFQARYDSCVAGTLADCDWNAPDGSDAVSAGPFMMDSIDSTNNVVTVVKNDNYRLASQVGVDKIIYKFVAEKTAAIAELSAGTVDIVDSQYAFTVDDLSGIKGITDPIVGDPAHQEISLNHYNPYWGIGNATPAGAGSPDAAAALNVRRAMNTIVDRDYIANEILEGLGQPATTVMPSVATGWDPSLVPVAYNLAKARTYMEAAGFNYADLGTPNADGVYTNSFFNVTVLSPNTNPARNLWSAAYVAELPKIGIGVTQHVSTGWADIIPRTFGASANPPSYAKGGFDIFFVGYSWGLDWDPTGLYDNSGLCTGGSCDNFMNYVNATVANDIAAYTHELNYDLRIQKVHKVQKDLYDDLPVLPLVYTQSHWAWYDGVFGIDPLLLSTAGQNWADVNIKPRTTVTSISVSASVETANHTLVETSTVAGTPVNLVAVLLGLSMVALVDIRRRRK